MKKQVILHIFFLISLIPLTLFGQATSGGVASTPNQPNNPGTDYLGWDNTVTVPLMIKTNNTGANAQDIDFYTNATQKMTIKGSNSTDDGYVGIDNANPSAVLHIDGTGTTTATGQVFRTDGPSGSDNQWRMFSNNSASNE